MTPAETPRCARCGHNVVPDGENSTPIVYGHWPENEGKAGPEYTCHGIIETTSGSKWCDCPAFVPPVKKEGSP